MFDFTSVIIASMTAGASSRAFMMSSFLTDGGSAAHSSGSSCMATSWMMCVSVLCNTGSSSSATMPGSMREKTSSTLISLVVMRCTDFLAIVSALLGTMPCQPQPQFVPLICQQPL